MSLLRKFCDMVFSSRDSSRHPNIADSWNHDADVLQSKKAKTPTRFPPVGVIISPKKERLKG
jgi:hypothetical protein